MEIFKLEWCNLYCWTYQGSAVWHIRRDERYWGMCWQVLADYWWQHCMPASLKSREMEAQATQATLLDLQDLMYDPALAQGISVQAADLVQSVVLPICSRGLAAEATLHVAGELILLPGTSVCPVALHAWSFCILAICI